MCEGLLLAYPNALMHKESSFRLKDPTRPCHRKVPTLHLVDPRVRVLSTANVPPQQADRWAREVSASGCRFEGLPKEVLGVIVENVAEFPITRNEAVRLREEPRLDEQGAGSLGLKRRMARTESTSEETNERA